MKIRDGFMLREIADTWMVMPIGANAAEFKSMLKLNETAAFIWKKLQNNITKEELVSMVLSEYDIDDLTANSDVEEIVALFDKKGLLE
ncbi:MAG TPA: PqqD family protein [Syntrophomonadaceae bacterium]|nr:PqqD family protein [Syntrophomonadaceae bacterium]